MKPPDPILEERYAKELRYLVERGARILRSQNVGNGKFKRLTAAYRDGQEFILRDEIFSPRLKQHESTEAIMLEEEAARALCDYLDEQLAQDDPDSLASYINLHAWGQRVVDAIDEGRPEDLQRLREEFVSAITEENPDTDSLPPAPEVRDLTVYESERGDWVRSFLDEIPWENADPLHIGAIYPGESLEIDEEIVLTMNGKEIGKKKRRLKIEQIEVE